MQRVSGWLGPRTSVWLLLLAAGLLTLDARLRDRGGFDYGLINLVRRIQFPGDDRFFEAAHTLTGTAALAAAWCGLLLWTLVRRRWLKFTVTGCLPIALAVVELLQEFVGRPSPDLARITGLDAAEPATVHHLTAAFPSGHVAASLVLAGMAAVFVAHGRTRRVAGLAGGAAAVVTLAAALSRVWLGEHWVGDTAASLAIGGAVLVAAGTLYLRAAPYADGLPLVRAARIPHDEAMRHAHALTSTVVFTEDTVAKAYAPGFVPTALYWLAFQAPFGYAYNEAALRAAVHRRNLAGLLTTFWFGESRVARALEIGEVHGRQALVSERVRGSEPIDHAAARRFLDEMARRFDGAGLPTWQIDPRQPRSLGNVLQLDHDSRMVIIDLESGLVSPLASPRAWLRGFRRGLVPMYDDVFFDITRDHIEANAADIRAKLGDAWLASLRHELDLAEQTAVAWHMSEPRVWSRAVRWMWAGFGIPVLGRRLRHTRASAGDRATVWLDEAIGRWEAEGVVSDIQAAKLRAASTTPDFQAVLPHFGVHLAIGVALRFPFGSLARLTYTGGNLLFATLGLFARRTDRATWRQAVRVHSPLVLLLAAMPGVGTFSYLASPPMRQNTAVLRLVLDRIGQKAPARLYTRTGLRRLVTGAAPGRRERR
ncbi:MAG: phosphatase PAP2 family protein [Dehalococcoidia bacterium]